MGLTYLFIAHDLNIVKYISDRIGVMYLGNMVELATSDELYANTLHPYSKALLSAVPIPDPKLEAQKKRQIIEGDVPSPLKMPKGCAFSSRAARWPARSAARARRPSRRPRRGISWPAIWWRRKAENERLSSYDTDILRIRLGIYARRFPKGDRKALWWGDGAKAPYSQMLRYLFLEMFGQLDSPFFTMRVDKAFSQARKMNQKRNPA